MEEEEWSGGVAKGDFLPACQFQKVAMQFWKLFCYNLLDEIGEPWRRNAMNPYIRGYVYSYDHPLDPNQDPRSRPIAIRQKRIKIERDNDKKRARE